MSTDHGNPLCRWLGAVALACVSLSGIAQPVTPQVVNNASNAQFGAWYFGGGAKFGTSGTSMVPVTQTPTNPLNLSGWTTAGNFGVAPEATGVTFNAAATPNVPGAKTPPTFNIKAAANMASVGAAIGGFAAIATAIQAGVIIYDFARELGFTLTKDPATGATVVQKDVFGCTQVAVNAGTCYFQVSQFATGGGVATKAATRQASCDLWKPRSGQPQTYTFTAENVSGSWFCLARDSGGTIRANPAIDTVGTPGNIPMPSNMQEFIDSIAAKSGWPATSNLAKATRDAMNAGQTVTVGTPTVTGPASSAGESSSKTNPDGSREATSKTVNYTYAGDTVTWNVTNTTNYYNSSNVQTGTSTSTTDAPADDKNDPCKVNPDSVGCMKRGDVPTDAIPKVTKTVTYAQEDLGLGAGGCPAGPTWTDRVGSHAMSLQPVCDLATGIVKPILLAMAALGAVLILVPKGD